MGPDLYQKLSQILGQHFVFQGERQQVVQAAEQVETWDELPPSVKHLLRQIQKRSPAYEKHVKPLVESQRTSTRTLSTKAPSTT